MRIHGDWIRKHETMEVPSLLSGCCVNEWRKREDKTEKDGRARGRGLHTSVHRLDAADV